MLFACITLNAQSTPFEEGYIIQKSDTIHGYIKSGSDLDLSKSITFKTGLNSEDAKDYSPSEINGFHFKNTGFTFASVDVEIIKGSFTQQTRRFAKLLLSGYTNLYKLQIPTEEQSIVLQSQNTFVYVLKKDSTYYTLGSYETQVGDIVRTNKRYIGVLRAAFNDCKNYQDKLEEIRFNDKSIIEEVTKYNTCKDPDTKVAVHTYKAELVIKHGVEINYGTYHNPKLKDSNAQGYAAGYFWDIIQPDKSRKYSGRVGVSYMYYRYNYKDSNEKEFSGTTHYLRLPISGQYSFTDAISSTLSPFINIGVTPYISSNVRLSDIIPLFHLGLGTYHNRMRYSIQVDNEGFKLSNPKIFNFSIGLRLDK